MYGIYNGMTGGGTLRSMAESIRNKKIGDNGNTTIIHISPNRLDDYMCDVVLKAFCSEMRHVSLRNFHVDTITFMDFLQEHSPEKHTHPTAIIDVIRNHLEHHPIPNLYIVITGMSGVGGSSIQKFHEIIRHALDLRKLVSPDMVCGLIYIISVDNHPVPNWDPLAYSLETSLVITTLVVNTDTTSSAALMMSLQVWMNDILQQKYSMEKIGIMGMLARNMEECDVRTNVEYNDLRLQEYLNLYFQLHAENPVQHGPMQDQIVNHIFDLINEVDRVSIVTLLKNYTSDEMYRGIEDNYRERATILFRQYPYQQMLIYPYLRNKGTASKV